MDEVRFERALFFSWYCSKADCTFCYMSTQKDKIDPKKGRRSFASIIAETIIAKKMGWKIEFISGGYKAYTKKELVFLVKIVHKIMNEKPWLNLGTLTKKELELFKPDIEGYCGSVESVNWKLRKEVCPSKKMVPILRTYKSCEALNLKKAMTIIIGLGETIKDFENLKIFIKKNKISRITFYALNPHPGTGFTKSPDKKYYADWILKTRNAFPKLDIIAGAWSDKTEYYYDIIKAGANSITKLPAIRKFGSKELKDVELQVKKAGKTFKGTLTKLPNVDWEKEIEKIDITSELKIEVKIKLNKYLKRIKKC